MNTDRDPNLMALFAQAEQEIDDSFVQDVLRQIDQERRRILIIWSVLGLFIIACLAVLAAPVFSAVNLASQLLPVSLVDIETEWVRQLVSPINSVAAVIAVLVLGIRKFFRSVFR